MYSCVLSFFHMAVNMHRTSGNQATAKTSGNATQNLFTNILLSNWYQASCSRLADFRLCVSFQLQLSEYSLRWGLILISFSFP